jgi:hypothetical protein
MGYLGDPEETAATFPDIDGTRYVIIGDRPPATPMASCASFAARRLREHRRRALRLPTPVRFSDQCASRPLVDRFNKGGRLDSGFDCRLEPPNLGLRIGQ